MCASLLAFARASTFVERAQIGRAVSSWTHEMAVNNNNVKRKIQARYSRICSVCLIAATDHSQCWQRWRRRRKRKMFLLILFGESAESTGCCVSCRCRCCWAPSIHYSTTPNSEYLFEIRFDWFGAKLSLQLDPCWVVSISALSIGSQSNYLPSVIWRWCHMKVSNGHTGVNAANHSLTCHYFTFTHSHTIFSSSIPWQPRPI